MNSKRFQFRFSRNLKQFYTAIILISFSYPLAAEIEDTPPSAFTAPKVVWTISMDNDLFAPTKNGDRDFTGGMAVSHSSTRKHAASHWEENTLGQLDRWLGIYNTSAEDKIFSTVELGSYGFTPDNNDQFMALGDRPYSSLVYLSFSRVYDTLLPDEDVWTSTLTIGALGWDVFGRSQNAIHSLVGSDKANGWDTQISDGGELTARYQIAYHDFWRYRSPNSMFKTSYFASLGYITEAGIALSTRNGLISSSSQRFTPELIRYGEQVNQATMSAYAGEENYLWGGVAIKARAYNAFLQGQFKDSEYTLNSNDIRPVIAEAWLGYTASLNQQFKFSYVLRAQSSELRGGDGDRAMVWAGLVLSHTANDGRS